MFYVSNYVAPYLLKWNIKEETELPILFLNWAYFFFKYAFFCVYIWALPFPLKVN
jgi:hypothetical protein